MSDGLKPCERCGERVDPRILDDEGLCPFCADEEQEEEEQEDEQQEEDGLVE